MLRRITTNYHKNYFKISDDNGKNLKIVDIYKKKITHENMNERLINFFYRYKDDFDFLNELQYEFLLDKEANIYKNYFREFLRDEKGRIQEENIYISSLEKNYRVKYWYNDFYDLLKKEVYYDNEIICVISYMYKDNLLEYVRKLDLNNFDSDDSYFDFGENMDFEYLQKKLSLIKIGEEEFLIEYIGDVDIIARSEKRRFEFKLDGNLHLKRLKTYVYYEKEEKIEELLFAEKEFFYENDNVFKRVMKIEGIEYISEYNYDESCISQIITKYNEMEIYRKSFNNLIEKREVFQKYEDKRAYSLGIRNNKVKISIPEDYLDEELEIFTYDKQILEEDLKTGRIYVTEKEILKNRRLYDNLTFLSSNVGVEKYEDKDYLELDFFQKENILLLDPLDRNIIFLKTKWYI